MGDPTERLARLSKKRDRERAVEEPADPPAEGRAWSSWVSRWRAENEKKYLDLWAGLDPRCVPDEVLSANQAQRGRDESNPRTLG